uniref:Protein kinase domain-containing protein n=1 Tax=Timema tahoe TaxID=61484 RepID=A0A7R9P1Q9_9NEOP|nr:unnamed protein product [Timema tahoe]
MYVFIADRELTYNSLTMIHVDESDPVGGELADLTHLIPGVILGIMAGLLAQLSYLSQMEPSFPYRDIVIKRGQDVKDLFLLQTEIGRGKFGTVYRCQEHSTGLQLAAKFVSTSRREDRRNVEREIDIMRALQHPRLIQLYDAFDNGKVMVLILELSKVTLLLVSLSQAALEQVQSNLAPRISVTGPE